MNRFKTAAFLVVFGGVTVVSFQNCGADFVVKDDLSFASSASECEIQLAGQFESSYHSFLKTNCAACHSPGGSGKGAFASANVGTAFSAFLLATSSRIDTMAVTASHASGYTGAQNTAAINAASQSWNSALASCNDVGDLNASSNVVTVSKTMAATATNKNITFNLDSEVQVGAGNYGGARLTIAVRTQTLNGYTTYFFSSPTLEAGSRAISLEGMMLKINGQTQTLGTTYSRVQALAQPNARVILSTSQLLLEYPGTASDTLAISIESLEAP